MVTSEHSQLFLVCPELRLRRLHGVVVENFIHLHFEGKKLISGWFQRAWREFENSPDEVFEPFIFLWFAFNGWASCVTNRDKDVEIIDALAGNDQLHAEFSRLMNDPDSRLRVNAQRLVELLPIFDARALMKTVPSVPYELGDDRRAHVRYYADNGADRYEPACWMRHIEAGEALPIDWPHVLRPIYKIRCNLFHGQKSAHSEMDQRIVRAAFLTLGHFLRDARYLEVGEEPSWFA